MDQRAYLCCDDHADTRGPCNIICIGGIVFTWKGCVGGAVEYEERRQNVKCKSQNACPSGAIGIPLGQAGKRNR